MASLRVLTFSSLYPSVARPRHGIFVEARLLQLMRRHPVDARVIAPVPWFPFSHRRFGSYAQFAATPRHERRQDGLQVSHPRYAMLPGIGMHFQPDSLARAAWADVQALRRNGWTPDIVDAHYLYPDGVAAARLAERLCVPFVMTARGTDVNVIAAMPGPGRRILEAARQAAAVIAVSGPLKDRLVGLGVDPAKVTVLRNGVDGERFQPADRVAARARLGLPARGRLLASVGNLLPVKGQALAIEALRELGDGTLVVVGEGPLRETLAELARRAQVESRVIFRPSMPQDELRWLYAACDALLLTSLREGWPNVVLEAMACATPVIAVDVGAVGEMITDPRVGTVVKGRDASAFAAAVRRQLDRPTDGAAVRAHAMAYDWASISDGQWALFQQALARRPPARQAA